MISPADLGARCRAFVLKFADLDDEDEGAFLEIAACDLLPEARELRNLLDARKDGEE